MAELSFSAHHQAHPRRLTCPCVKCNEDLLVFDDDDDDEQFKNPLYSQETGPGDVASFIAVLGKTQIEHQNILPQHDPYHPRSKGDATWDGHTIYTADGWILFGGPIQPVHYERVKGVDLVRWFTENYIIDKKRREKAHNKKSLERNLYKHKLGQHDHSKQASDTSKKRPSTLLALPAELRTAIYSYTISTGRVLIYGNKPNKELAVLKTRWNSYKKTVHRPSYRLSHLLDNNDIHDGLNVSSSLLLVCKKVNKEVELFIYAQLRFCFDSTKVLRTFISRASQNGLKAMRKLELHHNGYGEPKLSSNTQFKSKHDQNWRETCQQVARGMPALEWLRLEVKICDSPVTLRRQDRWFRSLLELISNRPLKYVEVALAHNNQIVGKDRLLRASRRVENHMMTAEGQRLRDEREKQRTIQLHMEHELALQAAELERLKLLPPIQATQVLKITLDEKAGPKETVVTLEKQQKKYYSSKTAMYAKELSHGDWWNSAN